jgi:hypothetical protein
MFKSPVRFILSVLVLLLFTLPAAAIADDSPPPLAEIWLITPKAGHQAEFMKALVEHMAFRSSHGDPRAWETYTPVLGKDLNRVGIRYCCFNWADQDSYEEWAAGATEIRQNMEKTLEPHIEKSEHYLESLDWGNSHWVEADKPYRFYAVTEYTIKPGHAMAFDAARDKISQIALNQGWATDNHPWLWASTIGGEPVESIIIPHVNYASFERSGESFLTFLSRHMSADDAAALLSEFANASSSMNFQIWEHQENLSMKPGE